MINKIDYIKNFGCFEDYNWDNKLIPQFKKVNILYGYNGSGKTTLSNLFYLIAKNCKNKNELTKEYILDNTSFNFDIGEIQITEKNYSEYVKDVYVFNSKFINDHIYDGSISNMDSFGVESKITNEVIDDIDKILTTLSIRNNKLITWEKNLNLKLNEIWNKQKNIFNDRISGKRLTNNPNIYDSNEVKFDDEKKELQKIYIDYENSEKKDLLIQNLELIKSKISEIKIEKIDLLILQKLLGKNLSSDSSQEFISKIDKLKSDISENLTSININDWLMDGNNILQLKKSDNEVNCPLCDSDIAITIDELIKNYNNYFNKNLRELFENLNLFQALLDNYEFNYIESKKKINEIKLHLNNYNFELKSKLILNAKSLKNSIKKLIQQIDLKRKNPSDEITFEITFFSIFDDIHKNMEKFNLEISEFIIEQEKEISKLSGRDIVNEIKNKIKSLAIAEYNLLNNTIFKSKRKNSEIAKKIDLLKTQNQNLIFKFNIEREREIIKLDAETRFVNIYLEYLGITKFIIKKIKDRETENIIISYKTGIKKNSLKFSLSEGEKTALAFSFFLSKIRAEQIEGGAKTFDKAIIVIDDPISSLDENRLFQTANLIDTFFHYNELADNKIPSQSFIFSHNINFLKYVSNIFNSNEMIQDEIREYYIDPNTHSLLKIPNSLKNFTTTYIEKLGEIIKCKEGKLRYDEAKKHIPNYIRIVLETYLSFKLALVKEGNKDRLPGLKFLISQAIKELKNFDDKIEIGKVDKKGILQRLNNLKRIADNESHGSISKIEALNYISEQELKDFCKHTIQIINYFDEIHFKRVSALIPR